MKIGSALLIAGLACTQNAAAGQFWSEDKVTNGFIIADHVLTAMDWAQTRYIADHPEDFRESASSEFLGEHPTTGEVNSYFLVSTAIVDLAGYFLPEYAVTFGIEWNPKKALYVVDTVREGYCVQHNREIGLHFEW